MTDGELKCMDCSVIFVATEDTDLDYPRCRKCEIKALEALNPKHPDSE